MLGNGNEHRLVISRCVDRCEAVEASREAIRDVRSDDTVDCCSVNTLEECKDIRVRRGRLVEGGQLLNNNVRVADNAATRVDLLRCTVVVALCIDKVTCIEVVDRHLDGELLVCWDRRAIGREDKL